MARREEEAEADADARILERLGSLMPSLLGDGSGDKPRPSRPKVTPLPPVSHVLDVEPTPLHTVPTPKAAEPPPVLPLPTITHVLTNPLPPPLPVITISLRRCAKCGVRMYGRKRKYCGTICYEVASAEMAHDAYWSSEAVAERQRRAAERQRKADEKAAAVREQQLARLERARRTAERAEAQRLQKAEARAERRQAAEEAKAQRKAEKRRQSAEKRAASKRKWLAAYSGKRCTCGKPLTNAQRKYCGKRCALSVNRPTKAKAEAEGKCKGNCETCGAALSGLRRKFCNQRCINAATEKRQRARK